MHMPVGDRRHGRLRRRLAPILVAGTTVGVLVSPSPTAAVQASGPPSVPEDYVTRGFSQLQSPGDTGDDDVGGDFGDVAMSDSGRFVVFDTTESLGAGDDGQTADIYLIDRDPPDPTTGERDGGYDDSGDIAIVLVSSPGDEVSGDGPSTEPDISADGRWVVFTSEATNLLPNEDDLDDPDVYLWDRLNPDAPLTLVSGGVPPDTSASSNPSISDDGARIAIVNQCFSTPAVRAFAVPPACGGLGESTILVWQRGTTTLQMVPRVDPSLDFEDHEAPAIAGDGSMVAFAIDGFDCPGTACIGVQGLGAYDVASDTAAPLPTGGHTEPTEPSVSASGELVAFTAVGSSTGLTQIYVLHRSSGLVDLVSSVAGVPGNGSSFEPSISSDGRYVAYATFAANILGIDDSEFAQQVVVRDLADPEEVNELVSVTAFVDDESSELGNGQSSRPFVSSNGGSFSDPDLPTALPFVAFSSFAGNLTVSDDGDFEHDVYIRSFLSAELLPGGPANLGDVAVGTTRTRPVAFQANPFGFGPVVGRRAFLELAGSNFSVAPLTCSAIQPGLSCSVAVSYSAAAIGTDENELVVEFDSNPTFVDGNESEGLFPQVTRQVRVTGAAGGLVIQPASVDFGSQRLGIGTPAVPVTVLMRGDPDDVGGVTFAEIVVTGPGAADYTISAGDCLGPTGVRVGDPCQVTIVFKPSAIGNRPAFIEFRSGGSGPVDLVPLAGAGIQPRIILNPAVVHSGGVIGVEGLDWPPGELVRLSIPSMPRTIDLAVRPDGTIELPTVIFRSRSFGPREVMAEVVDDPAVRLAQPVILLVQAPGANVVDIIGRN
jgi:WD40-like Beta Propeller Repeat